MSRIYKTLFSGVAVTAQQDLFEILAATAKTIKILRIELSQSTEVGDAQEEGLSIKLTRGIGTVTSGSGGSTHTPQPIDDDDAASGATVEINNTTKMVAGTGSLEVLESWNWNVRVPFSMPLLPEERHVIAPGNRLTIELATTPADSITMSGVVTFQEN